MHLLRPPKSRRYCHHFNPRRGYIQSPGATPPESVPPQRPTLKGSNHGDGRTFLGYGARVMRPLQGRGSNAPCSGGVAPGYLIAPLQGCAQDDSIAASFRSLQSRDYRLQLLALRQDHTPEALARQILTANYHQFSEPQSERNQNHAICGFCKGRTTLAGSFPPWATRSPSERRRREHPVSRRSEPALTVDILQIWTLNCLRDILSSLGNLHVAHIQNERGVSRGNSIEQFTFGKPHETFGNGERL